MRSIPWGTHLYRPGRVGAMLNWYRNARCLRLHCFGWFLTIGWSEHDTFP